MVKILATEIAFHGDQVAHMRVEIFAQSNEIVGLNCPPYLGVVMHPGREDGCATAAQSQDCQKQESFHSNVTFYKRRSRLKRNETSFLRPDRTRACSPLCKIRA